MKPIRVLLMLVVLCVSAPVANAQSLSATTLRALQAAEHQSLLVEFGNVFGGFAGSLNVQDLSVRVPGQNTAATQCPQLPTGRLTANCGESCWLTQAFQQCIASCLRLRNSCTAQAAPTCPLPAGCVAGVACPLQVKSPAPCCCSKACACCESCKATKTVAVAPPMVIQVAHVVRPAKLVTPDLEAHCERMTHKGDMIVLEGSVLLLSKKHAQPVRVEGQRILVNLKDGSFTVESVSSMTMPAATSFGIMRTSLVEPATCGSKVMVSGFQFDQPLPEMNLLNRYIGQFYSGREIVQFEDLPSRQWLPTPATSDRIIRVVPVPPMLPPEVPARSPATPIWMPK